MGKITTSRNIGEILQRWPHLAIIFLEHRMSCPGCYLASFENLADALEIYRIPVETFLNRLNEAIEIPEKFGERMIEKQIRETLKEVYDPEVGINIVDMGLVYLIEIRHDELYIQMTMTSPTCPLSEVIIRNMDQVLRKTFSDLKEMTIELVWDPPWGPEMMSDEAKSQLGWS